MVTGGALRIRHFNENGMPERVTVKAAVARRCEFLRESYLNDDEGAEHACAIFRDPRTGEVYGQLVEPEDGER